MKTDNFKLGDVLVAKAREARGTQTRFRVTLEKVLSDLENPFKAFRTAESFGDATCKVLVRVWEFEAKDEDEVRRLFEEAKREGLPQVVGMRIRSIEKLKRTQ